MQGSRVLLVEVQALTASSVIGAAKRKVSGVSADRVGMIIAVLEKRGDLKLAADDVFVNVAGGVRVDEPGADLAIALAVASANSGTALDTGGTAQSGGAGAKPIACFGEVGLTGELRYVAHADRRLAEAKKFGLDRVLAPTPAEGRPRGLETVDTIPAALRAAGAKRRLRAAA
jgi:DNA repair protein RadA/Sms